MTDCLAFFLFGNDAFGMSVCDKIAKFGVRACCPDWRSAGSAHSFHAIRGFQFKLKWHFPVINTTPGFPRAIVALPRYLLSPINVLQRLLPSSTTSPVCVLRDAARPV
jgi:hypothetical protein